MEFAFKLTDANAQAAFRRIAGQELAAAARHCKHDATLNALAVHDIRKRLKKTRALLRLHREGFADYPAENAALAEIGRALSAARDCAVRLATFDKVMPGELPAALVPLRDRLAGELDHPANLPPGLADDLSAAARRAKSWHLSTGGDDLLHRGLSKNRRRALRALRRAMRDMTDDLAIHDLRKAVKDHWYHARLFCPVWPEVMSPITEAAGDLGEALGDCRDIDLLVVHAGSMSGIAAPARKALTQRSKTARAKLVAQALPLAERLLAGDPDEMARLWLGWARVWRD